MLQLDGPSDKQVLFELDVKSLTLQTLQELLKCVEPIPILVLTL